jgi:acetyltransferase-like isoleucine patch superfamily enzyme
MSSVRSMKSVVKPLAKRMIFQAFVPSGGVRVAYAAASHAGFVTRELYEWGRRSLVATPSFLSRCAEHGEGIAVDCVPYINGDPRIVLGSNIRISGKIGIVASSRGVPLLEIGDGVFIGSHSSFAIAERITIGTFVSIGAGCFIADTEGHSHYDPQRPIWEVPASSRDIAPVTIEDGAQISRNCLILKGVTIGARSVIGAGSVVRTDIPPDSVVMGNPARVIKRVSR